MEGTFSSRLGGAGAATSTDPIMTPVAGVSLLSMEELEPVVAGDTPLYQQHFGGSSILIAKIVGMDDILFTLPAKEQLNWLHDLHVRIDAILKRSPATKVDFSGNMLQFVSGTENQDADHANTLVALAKELLALGNRVNLPNGQPLQMQMGMHTGECMTGVVGSMALKYGVFGTLVTVAKQLESLSAPGLLRISADTLKCVDSREKWVPGGSLQLADWSRVDTFLLGAAADSLSPADLRSAHAAYAQGAGAMTAILTFKDQRLEVPYLRLRHSGRRRTDAAACAVCLGVTVVAVATLALQRRLKLPSWLASSAGRVAEGTQVQLALGLILAWATALWISTRLPLEQFLYLREPVFVFLRLAASVHRVAGLYRALLAVVPMVNAVVVRGTLQGPLPEGSSVPAGWEAVAYAMPLVVLSFLLPVRFQMHLQAALACMVSELLQLAWAVYQGTDLRQCGKDLAIYGIAAVILPGALLWLWERLSRRKFLDVIR